jgi:tRNA nucleotidyltransferase (CCA-adding enzyme)
MRVRELIAAHTNTDFDAFAAMVAARKLYPEAALSMGGAVNRNVREFQALYADLVPVVDPADVELEAVERLVLVDTMHANRLGELAPLCEREDVQVVVFDHHQFDGPPPTFVAPENLVTGSSGSLVTLMLRIISERGIPVTPFEASLFALGIHEDTGSLTFSTTTPADAEALAFCMRHGADAALLEKWLTNALTVPQRRTLAAALESCVDLGIPGVVALVAALREDLYVEGVSVVAHRVMDLTGCDAFFLLVAMESRVFVTARSRGGRVDVAEALAAIGGGGHAAAASAVVKDRPLEEVRRELEAAVAGAVAPVVTARDAMAGEFHAVGIDESVDAAAIDCRRLGVDGLVVLDGERLAGTVALADLERAAGHGLGHAPVKAVMMSRLTYVTADDPVEHAARMVAEGPLGWVPVLHAASRPADGDPRPLRTDVAGMVTRAHVAGGRPATAAPAPESAGNIAGRLAGLGLDDVLEQLQAVAAEARGVYLVGGAVRDLLLGEPHVDLDVAVEGDGIAVARALARRLKGHVRPHEKFGTAVVVADRGGEPLRIDIASTRSESYDYPAALPKVEHATIRSDLARRDFTINAMAMSLKPETYGALLDFFGGLGDLEARRIVVLHNLSFIEDPTRILRAIRYESRYGLRMDAHTYNLARACSAMDLVGDLSSARLRDELVLLLGEEKVAFALRRLEELGLGASIHGRLRTGEKERLLIRDADASRRRHRLEAEVPAWRLRLVWLLRDLGPEEIASWAQRMRIRRRDAEVLEGALVVARRLADRIARGPTEAEVYDLAEGQPVEALLVAMTLDETGNAADRLGRFLDVSRHVRLEIGGEDLLAMGIGASPRLGKVLRTVLHLKLNGLVAGRDDELAAARLQRGGR